MTFSNQWRFVFLCNNQAIDKKIQLSVLFCCSVDQSVLRQSVVSQWVGFECVGHLVGPPFSFDSGSVDQF